MTAQQHPLLSTLQEWEQITDLKQKPDNVTHEHCETSRFVVQLVRVRRGKPQRLPSPVLQPV